MAVNSLWNTGSHNCGNSALRIAFKESLVNSRLSKPRFSVAYLNSNTEASVQKNNKYPPA